MLEAVVLTRIFESSIGWQYNACGDDGSMSNFADGPHDLSKFISSGEMPIWAFDDHSARSSSS